MGKRKLIGPAALETLELITCFSRASKQHLHGGLDLNGTLIMSRELSAFTHEAAKTATRVLIRGHVGKP